MDLLATITEEQRQAFELAGLPGPWLRLLGVALLGLICYGVVQLYRREARAGASLRFRLILAGMRCLVLIALAIVWLEPVIASYTVRTIQSFVVVLADASASMALRDAASGGEGQPPAEDRESRTAQLVRLLAGDNHAWLQRLSDRNAVLLYSFGEKPERLPLPAGAAPGGAGSPTSAAASPNYAKLLGTGTPQTDLGRALASVVEDVGENPLAAVIVLSDGGLNRGMSAEELIAYAQRLKAPIHSVGIGSPEEPANLRVTSLSAPATSPKDDPIEVRAQVQASALESTAVEVELTATRISDNAAPEERVVGRKEITLGGDTPSADLGFRVEADVAGEFLYRLWVKPLSFEVVVEDNARETPVLVLDQRLRVLLIAGRPSYDYRFVSRLLERDKTIDVSNWLQSADQRAVRDGDIVLEELPTRPEDLLAYDAIVLMDPNPRDLQSSWALAVRRLVDEFGGGLLVQAGPHYTSRFLRDPRLEELVVTLPVSPDPEADVRLSEQGTYRTRGYPIEIPDENAAHPLLQIGPDPRGSAAVWSALPGVWWYLPVMREKPIAAVLMRHSSRAHGSRFGADVLLAVEPFGSGRTAFLAFDSTWRWRGVGEQHFNRFWIQLIRYLAEPRRQGVSKRGSIVLDREKLEVGEYVKIEARVLDSSFVPWQSETVEAELAWRDGFTRAITLTAIPGREGWFQGRVIVDHPRAAVIRVPLPGGEPQTQPAGQEALIKHVYVQPSDLELRSLRMESDALQALARGTGGNFVPIADAARVPDWIESASIVRTTRGANRPLWDRWWVLSLIAVMLSAEWALRRRNHLL